MNKNHEKKVKNYLSQSAFWVVNKSLTRKLGLEASLVLSELITWHDYFSSNGTLEEGGFYRKKEDIEKETLLSSYQQLKACELLEKHELLKVVRRGLPSKHYYYLDFEAISKFMDE